MRRFAFRLAFHLGIWDVPGMLRSMSGRQLREWSVFAELEPFGEDRQDARFGSIAQLIANANRDRKKRSTPYTLHDLMLDGGDVPAPETVKAPTTWEKMKGIAQQWAGAMVRESKRGG